MRTWATATPRTTTLITHRIDDEDWEEEEDDDDYGGYGSDGLVRQSGSSGA